MRTIDTRKLNADELAKVRAFYYHGENISIDNRPELEGCVTTYQCGQRLCGVAFIGRAGKPYWQYSFRNEEQRAKYIADFWQSRQNALEAKARKAQGKAKAMAEFVNPYHVGDLLYGSWGYDQTNIDYFQVVAVGQRSLQLRPVGCDSVDIGFMQGRSKPVKDRFTGPPVWVTIQIKGCYDGTSYHSVPSPVYGTLSPCTEKSEHYWSSYA